MPARWSSSPEPPHFRGDLGHRPGHLGILLHT
jgi:hypothetical protein